MDPGSTARRGLILDLHEQGGRTCRIQLQNNHGLIATVLLALVFVLVVFASALALTGGMTATCWVLLPALLGVLAFVVHKSIGPLEELVIDRSTLICEVNTRRICRLQRTTLCAVTQCRLVAATYSFDATMAATRAHKLALVHGAGIWESAVLVPITETQLPLLVRDINAFLSSASDVEAPAAANGAAFVSQPVATPHEVAVEQSHAAPKTLPPVLSPASSSCSFTRLPNIPSTLSSATSETFNTAEGRLTKGLENSTNTTSNVKASPRLARKGVGDEGIRTSGRKGLLEDWRVGEESSSKRKAARVPNEV